ncbi:MAG TPA: DNA replication/repair protein RecF [Bacteroidetes bacterium]|nr:DNA replication/repair protein RecF [Bacteroidota bacterium]
MFFSDLQLSWFRNYESLSLQFVDGINCLTGNNGAGKTNVLEAVHYLALTRGWARSTEKYSIQEHAPYFMIEGQLQNGEERSLHIQCNYMPSKGKKMLLDKKPLARLSEHIGRIPLVTVLPNDTQLIHGSPSVRRKFMDGFISQYSPDYLRQLIRYDHALSQRNALLALFAERGGWDAEQLALWNEQLAASGCFILNARREFIKAYTPIFESYFHQIVSKKETPTLELKTQFGENSLAEWEQLLQASRDRDRLAHRTTVGTHKDDLVFQIDGQGVKNFGSQGQQKTFVIALKLAQYEILASRSSAAPVLLLDDIFDKLDMHRLQAIAGILDQQVAGQVFVTDTSPERTQIVFNAVKTRKVKYFRVDAGLIAEGPVTEGA